MVFTASATSRGAAPWPRGLACVYNASPAQPMRIRPAVLRSRSWLRKAGTAPRALALLAPQTGPYGLGRCSGVPRKTCPQPRHLHLGNTFMQTAVSPVICSWRSQSSRRTCSNTPGALVGNNRPLAFVDGLRRPARLSSGKPACGDPLEGSANRDGAGQGRRSAWLQ